MRRIVYAFVATAGLAGFAASPALAYETVAMPSGFSVAHTCMTFDDSPPTPLPAAYEEAQKPAAAIAIGFHLAFGSGVKPSHSTFAIWSPGGTAAVAMADPGVCSQ